MDGERDLRLRQRRVLAVILQHRERHGRPPTCREIAAACGLASTSSVADHITTLAALGYLIRKRRIARGLRPTARGEAAARAVGPAIGKGFGS